VTTAQIAMAAGIAEGTLFRVFPDKDSLIQAAVATAFETGPTEELLAAIDRRLPLRDKLVAAVTILQRRVEGVWQLMSMMGIPAPPGVSPLAAKLAPTMDTLQRQVVELFAPHRAELRCDPSQAARALRMMTFSATHPRISDGQPMTAAEVVAIVLDGIRVRSDLDSDSEADAEASC
jgi:AcrR family transcriptional regulator